MEQENGFITLSSRDADEILAMLSSDDNASSYATDSISSISNQSPTSYDGFEIEVLCQVCGEKAGKHLYYGGQVCPSCRAFFRRSVTNKYHDTFICRHQRNCIVNLKTRKSCQYCRFKKCLETGMKVSYVLPDGVRRERRVQNLRSLPTLQLTNDDLAYLGDLTKKMRHNFFKNIGEKQDFFSELLFHTYQDRPIPYKTLLMVPKMCMESTLQMIESVEGFSEINAADQRKILETNSGPMRVFKESVVMDEPKGIACTALYALKCGEFEALEKTRKSLEELNINPKCGETPFLKYDSIFISPWAVTYEDEVRHKEITSKVKNFVHDSEGNIDNILVALGFSILALDCNFVALTNRKLVELCQIRFLNLLRNYLNYKLKNKGQAMAKLASMIGIISYAREGAEILQHRRLNV